VEQEHWTLPRLARELGIKRPTAERLVDQYKDRLPVCQVVGGMRLWPPEMLEALRSVLNEERRIQREAR
jgi:hypothetical protein